MRREKFNKLFDVTWEKDEKTGKPKRKARYTGKYYAVDRAERNRARPWLLGAAGVAAAAFLAGGLINNLGSHCVWVMPFYALSILPVIYFTLAAVRIARLRAVIDEIALDDSVHSARRSAVGLTALGGLWTLTEIVFLVYYGPMGQLGRELGFLACGLACAGAGALALRRLKDLPVREIPRQASEPFAQ